MNLDIMSLMAASAAVSDSPKAGSEGATDLANASDDSGDSASFLSVLQGLSGSLHNVDDIDPAQFAGQPGTAGDQPLPLAGDDATLLNGELTEADTALPSGSGLPENGNSLPATALPAASGNPPVSAGNEVAAANLTQPEAAPVLSPAIGTVMTAADTRMAPTTQATALPQSAGWFTQRNTPNPRLTTTSAPPTAAGASVEAQSAQAALNAADLRSAPATDRALPLPQAAEPGTAALADRLQSLAAQSAGYTQALAANEASSLEAPRSILTPAISAPAAATSASAAPLPAPLAAPLNLNQSGWDKALGQRLVFMAANGLESAELRLDPPQLGTVHVKLSMQGDQAQVLLQASNPLARDAMETALPRLREMLDSEGLQLDSAQVSDRDGGDRQRETDARREALAQMAGEEGNESAESSPSPTHVETLTSAPGVISERV